MAAPVQRDEELELQVDSLAFGGNGVARLDGFVVFVRAGLPGDTVRARVTKVQRRHAEAITTEVLEAGPQRVEAPCAHYPACGGCRFQDLAYEAQLAAKQAWVEDSLRRIAGIAEPPLEPIVAAEELFGYRNKMEYSFAPEPDDGPPILGLHRAGRWDEVLGLERLLAHDRPRQPDPEHDAATGRARSGSRPTTRRPPRATSATCHPRGPQHRPGARPARHARARALRPRAPDRGARRAFPRCARSTGRSTTRRPRSRTCRRELLWGEEAIEEEIGGLRFRVRPNAFLQTNTRMAERLYELARAEAALTGSETVYDLYCGIGTIGLSLAGDALTVWGIEISEESVACAIENAELNSVGNAAFFAGNVGQVLRDLRERAGEPDVVVVDPPRAGLAGKALKRLGELAAPRVVYVSCNPTTLAGDTKRLVEEYGYRLVRTRPVDMFPHTPHVESVSLLERALELSGLRRSRLAAAQPPPDAGRTFGSRNPSEIAGSAGSPLLAQNVVEGNVDPEPDRHRDPGRERPQAQAHARAQEDREEEHVRQPEPGRAPAGHDEGDRELREHGRMVLGDRLRRAAPDRVGVDPRDDRTRRAPPTTATSNADRKSKPARRDRAELGEVREHRCAEHRQEQRRDRRSTATRDRQLARVLARPAARARSG